MNLGSHQEAFSRDLSLLFSFIFKLGLEIRIGEAQRTEAQQAIYIQEGKSKTSNSMHLKKCAIDLFLFEGGEFAKKERLLEVGKYWESLSELNRWGGSWRGKIERGESSFVDTPHFERFV